MAEMIPLHQELEGIESLSDLGLNPLSVSCESVPVGGVTVKDSGVVTMETASLVSMSDTHGMDSVQLESKQFTSPDRSNDGLLGHSNTAMTSSIENVAVSTVVPSIGEPSQDQAMVSHGDSRALQSPGNIAVATPTNVDMQELSLDESVSTAIIGEFSPELPKKWATSPSVCHEMASIEATDTYIDTAPRHGHMRFATISKTERTEGQLVVMPTRDGAVRSSPRTLSGVDTPTSSQVNAFQVSYLSMIASL